MSDFGFDVYAFDGDDAGSHPHPLEIARDLIATGKPRSALEVLSLHHQELAQDPEYLLICSEAWWACGDMLRAQQALLGAARLRPEDPTPLQMLEELFREQGENDKAERVSAKARSLEASSAAFDRPQPDEEAETEDDLIALAARREQGAGVRVAPKQLIASLVAAGSAAALITGIAMATRTGDEAEEIAPADSAAPTLVTKPAPTPVAAGSTPSAQTRELIRMEPPAIESSGFESSAVAAAGVDTPNHDHEPDVAPAPAAAVLSAPTVAASPPPERPRPAVKPQARAKAKPAPEPAPTESSVAAAPDAAVVQAELASLDARALTQRADALYAEGHTAVAAIYYRRALDIDPDYAPALVGIGRGILRAERYSEAMENATRALELARGVDARPGLEAEAIYQIGRVHLVRGELDAARRLLRQSISMSGTPPAAWFYLGEALWSDSSSSAREAYERYLELVPEGHLADRARRAIQ